MSVKHKTTGSGLKVTDAVWSEAHDVTWISPADEYLPLNFRTDRSGLIYYNDPYIIIRCNVDAYHAISWLAFGKTFGFGTYEWKAKAANAVNNCSIYLGLFEYRHGWAAEGAIFLRWVDTAWNFHTCKVDGTTENTVISGVDFTAEHTFKVEWTSTIVKFYVDGSLKASHSTAVPQVSMQLFAEIYIGAVAPSAEPTCYFRAGSFKKL